MTNPLIADRDRFAAGHPEQRVSLRGREWGVVAAGTDGPALVLIPGTLGRADIFWQQIEALAGRARVIAVTYPDSGGVREWAGDLAELLRQRGVRAATVLGSSLGGYLAQYFAAVHPELVKRLLAANTLGSVDEIKQFPPYNSDLDHGPIAELRAGFGRGLTAWGKSHPDQADLVALLMAEQGGRISEPELRARLKALRDGPDLPPVSLPHERIVAIESDDDPLLPQPLREALRARLDPGVCYRFAWGGHFPYVVRPAAYTGLLEEQLELEVTGQGWGEGALRRQ